MRCRGRPTGPRRLCTCLARVWVGSRLVAGLPQKGGSASNRWALVNFCSHFFAVRPLMDTSVFSVLINFSLGFFCLATATFAQDPRALQLGRSECFAPGLRLRTGLVTGPVRFIPLTRVPSLHHRSAYELRKYIKKADEAKQGRNSRPRLLTFRLTLFKEF